MHSLDSHGRLTVWPSWCDCDEVLPLIEVLQEALPWPE
jgi:hypothetical protein